VNGRRYAEVIVNAPIGKTLHYSVPDTLSAEIDVGRRLKVPLGSRLVSGYCVGLSSDSPSGIPAKQGAFPIHDRQSVAVMPPSWRARAITC